MKRHDHLLVGAMAPVLVLGAATAAGADVLLVPDDYPTIQSAVDAAVSGDVVLIGPGVYEETVLVEGKALALQATGTAEETIVDALGLGSVVTILGAGGKTTIADSPFGVDTATATAAEFVHWVRRSN